MEIAGFGLDEFFVGHVEVLEVDGVFLLGCGFPIDGAGGTTDGA
jgi:hypothetical protein